MCFNRVVDIVCINRVLDTVCIDEYLLLCVYMECYFAQGFGIVFSGPPAVSDPSSVLCRPL